MTSVSLLTNEVKELAHKIGLDGVGVTSAEPFSTAAAQIKQQIQRGLRTKSWTAGGIDSFTDPKTVLKDAKSIVVAAECYLTCETFNQGDRDDPHGSIAGYTRRNYYHDVKVKLRKIADFLAEKAGAGFRYRCFSNGPLAEKPMARRAGLGWYGNHGILVTNECGSWVVLGELITNVELEEDKPLEGSCGKCRLCIDACPTGAIVEPGILDMSRCLQHITHNPVVMPNAVRDVWGDRLYGCTTCQDVCPINSRIKPKNRKPEYGCVGPGLPLILILQMNERQYRERFHENQIGAGWVSFAAIQRNACVALGNIGDPAAVPILTETLRNNQDQIVRTHAEWALEKISRR